jgi:hypothetical protein
MQPDTRRKLDHVPALLEEEFPGLGHDAAVQTVESISRDVLARATIEDFVPVLVHRYARERILDAGRVKAPVS